MWQRLNSCLIALFCFAAAPCAFAVRPHVCVAVTADVPPFSARWKAAHSDVAAQNALTETARSIFAAKFLFLDWACDAGTDTKLDLHLGENPASHRDVGERPWILTGSLTTKEQTRPMTNIPVVGTDQIRQIRTTVAGSSDDVKMIVYDALTKLSKDGEDNFVRSVLSAVRLADWLDSHEPHVLIPVPHADLHSTAESQLGATFVGQPKRRYALTLNLVLQPLGPAPLSDKATTYTECSFTPLKKEFEKLQDYMPFIKAPRKGSPSISMQLYRPEYGTQKQGDKQAARHEK